MSFTCIPRKELDTDWWDKQLQACSNALVFGNSWFWDALVGQNWTGFFHQETGTMLQAAHRNFLGLPISYLPPIWCRPSGPYTPNQELLPPFSEFRNSLAYTALNIELHLEWQGVPGEQKVYQRSPIPVELKKNAIKNLKKNKGFDLLLTPTSPEFINAFFFLNRGKEMHQLKGRWEKAIERLMREGTKRGLAWNYSVQDKEGQSHAVACFFVYKNSLTYIHGSVNALGKKSGAMYYLFHELLNRAAKQGLEFVDFGGSNQKAIANFYQSFGGQDQTYTVYRQKKIPFSL